MPIVTASYQTDLQGVAFLYPVISIQQYFPALDDFAELDNVPDVLPQSVQDLYTVNDDIIPCAVPNTTRFRILEVSYADIVYRLEFPTPFTASVLLQDIENSGGVVRRHIGEFLPAVVTNRA